MDAIKLNEMPMAIGINHKLMPCNGRLIKSPEARHFDKTIDMYMIRLRSNLFEIRKLAKSWVDHGYCLKLELDFYWPKEKLISKQGHPKKNDLDNRIKCQVDAISTILDCDDKYVIEFIAHKKYWSKSYEICNATITPVFWKCDDAST